MLNRILITGGAGFVGSQLARLFHRSMPNAKIVIFDNLKRRGSELNLPDFKRVGIEFIHGDIREINDLMQVPGEFDLMIEASAEPSVLTGMQGESPVYAIETNLFGTVNALEFAKLKVDKILFLSTSRVYSIPKLQALPLKEGKTRLELNESNLTEGYSQKGISEKFSTEDFRSIYGSTKLASELLIREYTEAYNMKAVINRCGVIAGPGQFGKVDQGVFTMWVARHLWKRPLSYNGYGGKGLQVRDLLHPHDLFELILKQIKSENFWKADCFNVGGGSEGSTSLLELTQICQEITGQKTDVSSVATTSKVDIPYYVSDNSKVERAYNWQPKETVETIVKSIHEWLLKNEKDLKPLFT